jgi:metal-responsive CopG/Arc/MetJ family transcriptional regulator
MVKVLISIPDQLAARMRVAIPARQRSKTITHLIEEEVKKREKSLYECAVAVERDHVLNDEMKDWDITLQDGFDNESR